MQVVFFHVSSLFICCFFGLLFFCVQVQFFAHKVTPHCYFYFIFLLSIFSRFCTIPFIYNLFILLFYFLLCLTYISPHQFSSIKLHPRICVNRHASSSNFSSPYSVFICFVFRLCLFDFQQLSLNACQEVMNGIGWLDDRHGLSPILCDRVTTFVYIDQLYCHCVLI